MLQSEVGEVKCEIYSRAVGFLRPVSWFNKAKQQEFKDRQTYKIQTAVTHANDAALQAEFDAHDRDSGEDWVEVEGR